MKSTNTTKLSHYKFRRYFAVGVVSVTAVMAAADLWSAAMSLWAAWMALWATLSSLFTAAAWLVAGAGAAVVVVRLDTQTINQAGRWVVRAIHPRTLTRLQSDDKTGTPGRRSASRGSLRAVGD